MTPDQITAKTTAQDAFRAMLAPELQAFTQGLATTMTLADPEGPHKTRVAIRRMQALLAAFTPLIAKRNLHDLTARLRLYFRSLAPLRDADVLAQNHPEFAAKAESLRRKTRKSLSKHSAARLTRDAEKAFRGKAWHRKGRKALRLGPVTAVAGKAMSQAWAASLSHGPDLTSLAPSYRHDLRKSLKTLRYMAEFFAPLWPGAAQDAFLETLPALQDDLGLLNDRAMAAEMGLTAQTDPETLQKAQILWAKLQTEQQWWTDPA